MTLGQKLGYSSAIVSSILVFFGAYAQGVNVGSDILQRKLGKWPYATRATEFVVAGWQADRVANDLRDIKARIERLEIKRKVHGSGFNFQDQKELEYWYNQYRVNENTLKQIDQTRSPVWVQR